MPVQIQAKVRPSLIILAATYLCFVLTKLMFASLDAVAYAALLRNELLGAGIETVPDPHTDDRHHAVLFEDSHSLFRVMTDLFRVG